MIDPRLEKIKSIRRGMQSYVMMLYEFVLDYAPNKMLEIGVQSGQSTKTILMAMKQMSSRKKMKLVSIDRGRHDKLMADEYADLQEYWHYLHGDSHNPQTLEMAKSVLGNDEYYDMLFIDGDHSFGGVKQDFEEYSQLVKPGGIIMLHDIINKNEGVKDFWPLISWEKFALDWGHAGGGVTPGFGLVRKPYEKKS